jgi:hypothetical protein
MNILGFSITDNSPDVSTRDALNLKRGDAPPNLWN